MCIENGDQTYSSRIDAEGYTSVSRGPYIKPNVNNVFDFILYNALYYKADEQSTIILPVAPDPSAGTYYRLDRVENKIIIFEPEPEPKAHVPYVFFPNQDLRIDLRGMDLTTKNGGSTFINMSETNNEHEGVEFVGSYTHQCDIPMFESDWIRYFDSNAKGIRAGLHDLDAMHALLKIDGHAFRTHNIPEVFFMGRDKEYRSFIEEGKVWKTGWFNNNDNAIGLEYHFFDGDTIVGGQACKKMMCRYEYAPQAQWPGCEPRTEYSGALYEKGKIVYLAFPNSENWLLIYDFASPEDATIDFYDAENKVITTGRVSSKQTRQENIFHGTLTVIERLWDDNYNVEYGLWREGVGHNCLQNVYNFEEKGIWQKLMSCTVGDELLYYDPSLIDCVTPQDTEVKKNWLDFTHTVKTKPKAPRRGEAAVSDEETVTGEYSIKELFVNFKTLTGPYTITVTDAAGQPIYNKVVQTSNVVALNTDISAYAKGSYTITVENEEEAYSAEFTISDEDGLTPQPPLLQRGGEAGAVYNLNGQRLTKPQRGVNIVNGHKVVVK